MSNPVDAFNQIKDLDQTIDLFLENFEAQLARWSSSTENTFIELEVLRKELINLRESSSNRLNSLADKVWDSSISKMEDVKVSSKEADRYVSDLHRAWSKVN